MRVYLHGTNATAGGFVIKGTVKNKSGNSTYDLTYEWNDIIDPNFKYVTDKIKSDFAKKIPLANPKSFTIKIIWKDKTTIYKSTKSKNKGWLKK